MGGVTGKGGGGKKGQKSPTPPNFTGLAQQQAGYSTPWANYQNQNLTLNPQAQQAMGNIQQNMIGASQMDPTQARNQAIQGNIAYGQQLLAPQFQQQNQALQSGIANQGMSPQQQQLASTLLGNQQGGQLGGVLNTALNQGTAAQYAQMAQANQPFQQYNELINASLQRPTQPNLLGAGALQYNAAQQQAAQQNQGKNSLLGGLGGLAGTVFGGPVGGSIGGMLGGGKGGGGGGVPNYNFVNAPGAMNPGGMGGT